MSVIQRDRALAQWFAARTADRRAGTRKTTSFQRDRNDGRENPTSIALPRTSHCWLPRAGRQKKLKHISHVRLRLHETNEQSLGTVGYDKPRAALAQTRQARPENCSHLFMAGSARTSSCRARFFHEKRVTPEGAPGSRTTTARSSASSSQDR